MTPRCFLTLIAFSCAPLSLPVLPAYADTAGEFLASLEGTYAGRGEAKILGDAAERISCRIENDYDPDTNKLSLSGECASTKGKDRINGGVTANGTSLSGAFVSPRSGVTVTQSSGSVDGDTMVLSASLLEEKTQSLTRVRQVISKSETGLMVEFQTYDNASGSYESNGRIDLTKR